MQNEIRVDPQGYVEMDEDQNRPRRRTGWKKACSVGSTVTISIIAVCVMLTAIGIVALSLHRPEVTSNTGTISAATSNQIGQLENKNQHLERLFNNSIQKLDDRLSILNETISFLKEYVEQESTESQLDSLQNVVNQVNTVQHTVTSQIHDLQSSVDTLNTDRDTTTTQLSSLQSSVDTLTTATDTTTTQLSSLQSSVNTLTTRVNSPVNLYQNCIKETRACTITTHSGWGTSFWRGCTTDTLPITESGTYTTDMRCEYETNTPSSSLKSAILNKPDSSNIKCECDVTVPSSGGHYSLSSGLSDECILVITRCPLTLLVNN